MDEFVADQEHTPKCLTCRLPPEVLHQVHEGRKRPSPIAYSRIAAWLKSEGHDIKLHALRNHFVTGHADD